MSVKIDLISSREETRAGYSLSIRSSSVTNCGYDRHVCTSVSVSRRGVELCSTALTGPDDEDIQATGRVRELEERAIEKALERVDLIRMAFAGLVPAGIGLLPEP